MSYDIIIQYGLHIVLCGYIIRLPLNIFILHLNAHDIHGVYSSQLFLLSLRGLSFVSAHRSSPNDTSVFVDSATVGYADLPPPHPYHSYHKTKTETI